MCKQEGGVQNLHPSLLFWFPEELPTYRATSFEDAILSGGLANATAAQ